MRKINHNYLFLWLALAIAFSLTACSFGTPADAGTGSVIITDGPVDDPLYADVFITLDGVEIDGMAVKDFERRTINISQLQNGLSESLFEDEFAEGSYESISLILDFDKDDSGNTPGCYINTSYDRKVDLANGRTGKQAVKLEGVIDIVANQKTEFVIDFDLRKTIRSSRPGDESDMSLIEESEIGKALRLVDVAEAGDVKLTLQLDSNLPQAALFYLVYLYPSGSFDRATELFDGDGDGITYENALSSGKFLFTSIDGNASAVLPYVPEGAYDLILEAYERYEFSHFRLGYLAMKGKETILTPVSVKKGETVELNLVGGSIVE